MTDKRKRNNNLLYIVSGLFSLFILVCIGIIQLNSGEQDEDKEEKNRMITYLNETYNQKFSIKTIEEYDLGYFVGITLIEGKATDEEGNLFVISREKDKTIYKDTYKESVVTTLSRNEFEKDIKNINSGALFYIKAYYDNTIHKNMRYHQLNEKALETNFRIAILVDEDYSRDKYLDNIRSLVKKLYDRGLKDFNVNIDFLATADVETIRNYMELNAKEKTQNEFDDNDFYTLEAKYDEVTIDSFRYDGKMLGYEPNIKFIEGFFYKK